MDPDPAAMITDLTEELTRALSAKAYWRGVAEAAHSRATKAENLLTPNQREKLDAAP